MHEVFKLPALLFHFNQHKTTGGQTGLNRFLHNHYAHHSDSDNDREEDSQLPFKTGLSAQTINWLAVNHEVETFPGYVPTIGGKQFNLISYPVLSGYRSPLWQPPSVA